MFVRVPPVLWTSENDIVLVNSNVNTGLLIWNIDSVLSLHSLPRIQMELSDEVTTNFVYSIESPEDVAFLFLPFILRKKNTKIGIAYPISIFFFLFVS